MFRVNKIIRNVENKSIVKEEFTYYTSDKKSYNVIMDKRRVLLLGSGGREHAFARSIAQSNRLDKLFIAPGNAGTEECGENVAIGVTDFDAIAEFVLRENIDMVVVGPEDPLVKGIYDYFKSDSKLANIAVIGPSAEGARLEGSKHYAKEFMERHNIPTAAYKTFTSANIEEGYAFIDSLKPPYVLKADGLAAGKGVVIPMTATEAKEELKSMLGGKFGAAGASVVIEEFLSGIEMSVFVLTDGKNYKILPEAKDYKRIGDGDMGLNTGGMGAVSPVPFAAGDFIAKVEERIVKPTIAGFEKENIDYKGFVFIGLMNVDGDPYVIEYNVRMGDPETEVVLPRVKTDLVSLFEAVEAQRLNEVDFEIDTNYAVTVVCVSGGYPEDYAKGYEITGLESDKSIVFHAGTAKKDGKIVTSGGRVLAVTSLAPTMQQAVSESYRTINSIAYKDIYYRKDISKDLEKYI